jgi:hypothetical protein
MGGCRCRIQFLVRISADHDGALTFSMQHFFNTQARDPSLSRVVSVLNPRTPQAFPVLVIGTNALHQFFRLTSGIIDSPGTDTLRVTIADAMGAPSDGVFSVTGDETAIIEAGATAEDVASALNGIDSIVADGGVNVSGIWPAFVIAYREVGVPTGFTASAALLSPDAVAELTVLTSGASGVRELVRLNLRTTPILQTTDFEVISSPYAGWEGRLPLTSAAALAWLQTKGTQVGDYVQAQTLLTVETVDSNGNVEALYQGAVTIRATNYNLEVQAAAFLMSSYFTAAPDVTGLVSASVNAAKLGGLATVSVYQTGTTLRMFFANDVIADYRLLASTASENWPHLIRPYDYNASTNARQWTLAEVRKTGAPCVWNPTTSKFHFEGSSGAAGAVALEVDQTGFTLPA